MVVTPALIWSTASLFQHIVLIACEFFLGLLSDLLGDRTGRSMRDHNVQPWTWAGERTPVRSTDALAGDCTA